MNPLANVQSLRGVYAAVLCRPDGTIAAQTSLNPKFARALIDSAKGCTALAAGRAGGRSWHSMVLRYTRGTLLVRRSGNGTLLVWGTSNMDVASDEAARALRITMRGFDNTEPAPAMSGERPAADVMIIEPLKRAR
jgi:hypothetical protein